MPEPLKVTAGWNNYTAPTDELIQNTFFRARDSAVQIVIGTVSVASDTDIGTMADVQGTFLLCGESMVVRSGAVVNYRTRNLPFASLGRNAQ